MIDASSRLLGNAAKLKHNYNLWRGTPIGKNVREKSTSRIDGFCILTGDIEIGKYVHIASGCRILGSSGLITLSDGSFVSMGSTILTASDTYNDGSAIGPTFPIEDRNVIAGPVTFDPMSGIGAHTVIMPGCRLGFGSRVGACSFLSPFQIIPPFEIWAGCPARKIGEVKDKDRLKSIYARLIEGGQSLPLPMA